MCDKNAKTVSDVYRYSALLEAFGPKLGKRRRWLVTGAAGFIGSHLAEALLSAGQEVVGLNHRRSEERRVGKECRSRWSPYH